MFDDQAGWGANDLVSTGDVVKDAMKKEQLIKYVSFHVISMPCLSVPGISSLFKTI
jgi:hypothetical protein